jgi:hypothetical protein
MLGKQNQQTSFSDIESWLSSPLINPDSIYGLMSSWGNRLIQDSDFAELYSKTGRPSVSPALLSKVLLLKARPKQNGCWTLWALITLWL